MEAVPKFTYHPDPTGKLTKMNMPAMIPMAIIAISIRAAEVAPLATGAEATNAPAPTSTNVFSSGSNTAESVPPQVRDALDRLDVLLKQRDRKIDVGQAALIMAKVLDPQVDVDKCVAELDELARSFPDGVERTFKTSHRAESFRKHLFETLKYQASASSRPGALSGRNPDSCLHRVLENKRGDCLGLSVLAVSLGRKCGLPIYVVLLPGHIFVRIKDGSESYNLETTVGLFVPDEDYTANFASSSSKVYMRELTAREFIGALLCHHLGYELMHIDNRSADALACFDKAIEIFPCFGEILINRGATLRQMGRPKEALDCYARAIELDPENASAWHNRGNAFLDVGKDEDALQCFDKAVTLNPNHLNAWRQKASALHLLNKNEEALDCLRRADKIRAEMKVGEFSRGLERIAVGTDTSGRALIFAADQGLSNSTPTAREIGEKARLFGKMGRHKEAIALYDRALRDLPKEKVLWNNKGNSLAALGRYEDAVECYERALVLDPQYVSAMGGKARLLDRLGESDEAFALLEKAEKIAPVDQRIRTLKACMLAARGKKKEAIALLDTTELRSKRDVAFYMIKAETLTVLGEHQAALECYQKVQKFLPEDPSVLASKGDALCELERYEEALECADEALRLDSGHIHALAVKALAFCGLAQYDAASRFTDLLIQSRDEESEGYGLGLKAYVLAKQQKYAAALKYYEKAVELDPGYYYGYSGRTWIRATCHKDEFRDAAEAVKLAKKSMDLAEHKNFDVLSTLSCAFAEAGAFEEALSALNEATPLASTKKERDLATNLLRLFKEKKPYRHLPEKKISDPDTDTVRDN